ncbi:MAG: DUF2752 domain-containing protein [Planctomycetes bacterium]|nr:DUF2752 domain-containing protein [Planctomycetota bacterium]
MSSSERFRALHWVVVLASAACLAALVAMRLVLTPDPDGYGTHEQLGLLPCSAPRWFGIPCPGCGVTTSVTWFVQGAPLRSLSVQPLGFSLALAGSLALPLALFATVRGVDLGERLVQVPWRRLALPALAFIALCWLYKILALA